MADVTRVPPYDLDAEQSVLAACLVDRGVVGLVADVIEPKHFYREAHALVFGAMLRLNEAGGPVDMLTVKAELGARLDEAGGFGYLVDLAGLVATTAHAESYARIVRDRAVLRGLIAAGAAISEGAFSSNATAEEQHARAVSLISGLDVAEDDSEGDMGDFVRGYLERLEERGDVGGLHVDSPWYDLDRVWTGARGDLTILAARPAMGKTAWAINYAWHIAQTSRVDFWSLEMDRDRLMDRLVIMLEGVDYGRIKAGKLDHRDWEAVSRVAGRVEASGLRILKPRNLTAAGVRRATLKAKARGVAPCLVVIDYLQLMTHPRADRHDLAVGATSRALKLFAGEASVQVMALAQLNRGSEKEADKRPALTNLRDSGALEQDADAVLFLHRDAYYDPKAEQAGVCDVIVAKHRNGGTGSVALDFNPRRQVFNAPEASVPVPGDWRTA